MIPRLKLFLGLVAVFAGSFCHAQKYNFKNFSVNEGLAQSEIYSMCEDRRGNLWFGSAGGGLVRFDGYNFVSFREEDGLLNNYIRTIVEDSKGTLWIGTDKGVCVYNGRTFSALLQPGGPGKTIIRSIAEDRDGNIWIGTDKKGLFKYRNNRFEKFTTGSGLPDNTIHCLFVSDEDELWMGTNKGAARYKNHRFENYDESDGLVAGNIRAIAQDKRGSIWIASQSAGVSRFSNGSFTNYNEASGLAGNSVYAAFCDSKGNIWLGTSNGVSRWNGSSFRNFSESNGLGSSIVLCILEDATDDIWLGTSGGGVSRLDNARFVHFTGNDKMGRQVFAITQALNGKMVFATSMGGLTFFDGSDYSLLNGPDNFTASRVMSLYHDRDSALWIGTLSDGVYRVDGNGINQVTAIDSLIGRSVNACAMDTAGNMWFASPDNGICVMTSQGAFKRFNVQTGLLSNNIYAFLSDKKGNIWVGTDKGLNRISVYDADSVSTELSAFTASQGLSNTAIRCIATDDAGNVYLGTAGSGIYLLKGSRFINYDKKAGLTSNNIYALIFDNNGHLWAGTEQGVDRITLENDLKVEECRHFGKSEGFTGLEVFRNAVFKDRKGQLWFGTVNGATMYNPAEDRPFTEPPVTHLTGIKLFYDNIENTKYGRDVDAWYPIPHSLVLPYNQNSLTFNFAGIYQRNPEAVRYQWKLEGLSDEWSPALRQHEVTYSSLPPGKYRFVVKACNEYNVWSKNLAVFEFVILPPVWKRWWFVTIVAMLVIGAVWVYFRSRIEKIKEKNRIEKEKLEMEKNLIELEQEASRLQMNPHFIFNALNSVQGFISVNDAVQAKKYLGKFSRLMRLILENAREKYIPLKNEVEMLENYLDLEKVCKNNKFDYEIVVSDAVDAEMIEIPPMMIQPFVENAIIHGIKYKEGHGHIRINFELSNSVLICEVSDDGIGRKKSAEMKARNHLQHKSAAMEITQKRLDQLAIESAAPAGFQILDLTDGNGNPLGTQVAISIPVEC